jgi:transcriptional regulator with XRE-family HTH domain
MDEQLARAIGARVRAARVASHRTQVVVAGLAGITADYLHQIEHGKKLPTIPMLTQLAQVLNMPLSRLVEQLPPVSSDQPRVTDMGAALYQALTQPVTPHEPASVPELHDRVRSAWRTWQTSPHRYTKLGSQLPALITDTELGERWYWSEDEGPERRAMQCCAADLYGLLRTVAKRVGRGDLALLVADRAIRAAEAADDPHRLAAARWNLAHVLLADHQAEVPKTSRCEALQRLLPSRRPTIWMLRRCAGR